MRARNVFPLRCAPDPDPGFLQPHQTRAFTALLHNLKYFAGTQIRNVACIAGNIVTASPISDLNPVFVAVVRFLLCPLFGTWYFRCSCVFDIQGAVLKVTSLNGGERMIPMQEFFLGYRKTAIKPSEVVVSICTLLTMFDVFILLTNYVS